MFYIQVVDDEPIVCVGIQRMLNWKELGFEIVCTAQNGREALQQQEASQIDLIITDIEMPMMNGLEFIKEVREREVSEHEEAKEIIILTAYDDFEYARKAIRYGIRGYILKPVDIEDLTRTLVNVKKRLEERGTY